MAGPLRVGDRDQRYARTHDREVFAANFDAIKGLGGRRGCGRTRMVWRNGKAETVIENGEVVGDTSLTPNHLRTGISLYDCLKEPPRRADSPASTSAADIRAATRAI